LGHFFEYLSIYKLSYKLSSLRNKSIKTMGNNTANVIPIDSIAPVIPLPISDLNSAFMASPPQEPSCNPCLYYNLNLFQKFYETFIKLLITL